VGFVLPESAKKRYHKKFDTKEKQKMKWEMRKRGALGLFESLFNLLKHLAK
jgi:hypothetical protein